MTPSFHHTDAGGNPVLDLRAAAARRRPDLADLPDLRPSERGVAVRTWAGRMVNEHVSARVWAHLLGQGVAAALPADVLAGIAEAIGDELRHAEQCAAVVLALGGDPVAPLPPLPEVPTHDDAPPLEAFLRNLISVGCMSETVAVSVIRAEQAELDGTALGSVLDRILADEVAHARLGWRVLGLCAPQLDAATRARLSAYLVDAFAHQVLHEVPKLPRLGPVRPELARAGVCDGSAARDVFYATLETVIVPGLQAAGLDAAHAWAVARPLAEARLAG